ncbi:MAG: bifunctional UDP-N-acetylglucosamine diphosphorylase/glucosamine-1-phosphate N-acetyltransferase GlmU [Myxococcales bacterium]|nr:bifunctional UDP-N-acetylglucosamine diphosphorylase/glucosamine-1-phosphate N-acetyltransferase GlmU [Myxococcales bacterium]
MKSQQAKVLFEVGGEPMVAWSIRLALAVGADPIVAVVGHEAEQVTYKISSRFGSVVQFAHQAKRLGTGHAAQIGMASLPHFSGTVLILYGDVPLLEAESLQKLAALVTSNESPVAVMSTHLTEPTGYGRIVRDSSLSVTRIVEHKDASPEERAITEVNAGIYAIDSTFLREALSLLSNTNTQREYYLTDIVASAINKQYKVAALAVDSEEVQGANDRSQLAQLEAIARKRIMARHLSAGVTFISPEHSYVGAEVHIGKDCVIHPGVHLRGKTTLGAGVTVDVGSILIDADVASNAIICPYSVLEKVRVNAATSIGPFVCLRPRTALEETSPTGNFGPIKKATIAQAGNVSHLSYITKTHTDHDIRAEAKTPSNNHNHLSKNSVTIENHNYVSPGLPQEVPTTVNNYSNLMEERISSEKILPESLAFATPRQTKNVAVPTPIREHLRACKAKNTNG